MKSKICFVVANETIWMWDSSSVFVFHERHKRDSSRRGGWFVLFGQIGWQDKRSTLGRISLDIETNYSLANLTQSYILRQNCPVREQVCKAILQGESYGHFSATALKLVSKLSYF